MRDIELNVKKGEFIAVVGKVGCGKSSLLSAIMGDLFLTNGEIKKKGQIGYIP